LPLTLRDKAASKAIRVVPVGGTCYNVSGWRTKQRHKSAGPRQKPAIRTMSLRGTWISDASVPSHHCGHPEHEQEPDEQHAIDRHRGGELVAQHGKGARPEPRRPFHDNRFGRLESFPRVWDNAKIVAQGSGLRFNEIAPPRPDLSSGHHRDILSGPDFPLGVVRESTICTQCLPPIEQDG
jgi:hypothetical protein